MALVSPGCLRVMSLSCSTIHVDGPGVTTRWLHFGPRRSVCAPPWDLVPWHRQIPHQVGDCFKGLEQCDNGAGHYGMPLRTAGPISARR